MGLDSVELVMEVEDRFSVKLPDADCQRVRTVADLAALVIVQLPKTEGVCHTAHAFFQFRTLVVTHAVRERGRVRPKTRLSDLFPPDSRRLWKVLRKHDRRMPRLVTTPRADRIILWTGAITAFAWLMASAALWGSHGALIAVPLSMSAFAVGLWAFASIGEHLSQHFPPGIETVGDVARLIAPIEMRQGNPGERLVAQ